MPLISARNKLEQPSTPHHLKMPKLSLKPRNIIHGKRESPSRPSFEVTRSPRQPAAEVATRNVTSRKYGPPPLQSAEERISQPVGVRRQKLKSHSFSGRQAHLCDDNLRSRAETKQNHRNARIFNNDDSLNNRLQYALRVDDTPNKMPDSSVPVDLDTLSLHSARHSLLSPSSVSLSTDSSPNLLRHQRNYNQKDYFTSRKPYLGFSGCSTPDSNTSTPSALQDLLSLPPDWADHSIATTGLKNLGITCFMNAALQCLSATIPLARFLRDGSYRSFLNRHAKFGSNGYMTRALARLLTVMWSHEHFKIVPLAVRDAIWKFGGPQFEGFEQQDAQEVLTFLLDALHEDLNLINNKPKTDLSDADEASLERMPAHVAAEKEWLRALRRDNSVITQWFYGQELSRLTCSVCEMTSTTWSNFGVLPLQLSACAPHQPSVRLEDLIQMYCKSETLPLEDAWHCHQCKQARAATKTLALTRLPPILILHLSRTTYNDFGLADKDDRPVVYPVKHLNMSPFLHPVSESGESMYELYATINHVGSASFGHYTALVRSQDTWIECNDGSIAKVPADEVAKQ